MSVEAVLVRKSTKEIIKHDFYPREDMQPVDGMDPDYEWLVKHIPFAEPDYDPRIYIMGTNIPDLEYLESFQEHPSYPGIRAYTITYSPEKRPKEEIIMAINNAEKEANDSVWNEAIHKDEMMFMMSALFKKADNLSITSEEQEHIDKSQVVTMKLAKNLDNKNILIALVNSGLEPNIDSGWEK